MNHLSIKAQQTRLRPVVFTLILLAVGMSNITISSAATSEGVSKIVSKIHETYEKIVDLEADFVQTVEIQGFDTTYVSTGKLYIKKGKMLWDYVEPGKQMIYVNGGGFQFYVPDHKQVIRSKIGGQSDAHLPLQLLSGLGKLDQDFKVSFEIEAPKPGEAARLKLIPKKNMGLNQIVLTVIPSTQVDGLVIDQIVLYEKNGNVSTSVFEKVKINKGLRDTLFDFKIPEDVEVIDSP